jgi:aminoglycoside 6'-N-acetyltransferase
MIFLRLAKKSDIPILEYWDKQQHVIDCHSDSGDYESHDWTWEQELKQNPDYFNTYIAENTIQEKTIPIGVVQIIDPFHEESHYWGEVEENLRAIDIWIGEAKNLNMGYGTEMMRLAINICFKNPKVKAIIIDPLASNTRAINFYLKFGFKFVRFKTFGEDYCAVHRLDRGSMSVEQ